MLLITTSTPRPLVREWAWEAWEAWEGLVRYSQIRTVLKSVISKHPAKARTYSQSLGALTFHKAWRVSGSDDGVMLHVPSKSWSVLLSPRQISPEKAYRDKNTLLEATFDGC